MFNIFGASTRCNVSHFSAGLAISAVIMASAFHYRGEYPVLFSWLLALFVGAVIFWFYMSSDEQPGVDIWAPQRALMRASDQALPDKPTMNHDAVLYVALTLEEMAETVAAMTRVMLDSGMSRAYSPHRHLTRVLAAAASTMGEHSNQLRGAIADSPTFSLPLVMRSDIAELLDGVTDTAVTLAGLGLSMGLPVELAYTEVARSNASKVNPDTGVIDKTSDGKWIKGRNYTKPDLLAVLVRTSFKTSSCGNE